MRTLGMLGVLEPRKYTMILDNLQSIERKRRDERGIDHSSEGNILEGGKLKNVRDRADSNISGMDAGGGATTTNTSSRCVL